MVEWLSDSYDVNVNAIVLSYVKTKGGDELLMKTSIISEEMEQERTRKQKKFEIPMSDEPPAIDYDIQSLKRLLSDYLSRERVTNRRMRDILFPALLKVNEQDKLSRGQLKDAFIAFDPNYDESKVGYYLTQISSQLGMKKNDFLRQVVSYEYPRHHWEKDNFLIRPKYRDVVNEVLYELKDKCTR